MQCLTPTLYTLKSNVALSEKIYAYVIIYVCSQCSWVQNHVVLWWIAWLIWIQHTISSYQFSFILNLSNPYHQKWHKKSLSPSDLNHPWYCQRHSKPMHVLLVHMVLWGSFGPRPKKNNINNTLHYSGPWSEVGYQIPCDWKWWFFMIFWYGSPWRFIQIQE